MRDNLPRRSWIVSENRRSGDFFYLRLRSPNLPRMDSMRTASSFHATNSSPSAEPPSNKSLINSKGNGSPNIPGRVLTQKRILRRGSAKCQLLVGLFLHWKGWRNLPELDEVTVIIGAE